MTRAFLIGAGATRAQYPIAPLNDDFFTKLTDVNHPEWNKIYADLKKNIEPHLGTSLIDSNVEEVMMMSYQFPISIRKSFLASLYSAIYYLLAEPTESDTSSMNSLIHTMRTPKTIFKTLLDDDRLKEEDFFMTLNYDLYLDREILYILENKIDYGISEEFLDDWRRIELLSEPIFSVYHLHGSLNWAFFNDKLRIDQGAITPKYTRYGFNLCLVPPGKKDLNPVLKSIWEIASKRLFNADELIIIGSSLNLDDKMLVDFIRSYISKKGTSKIKIIYKENSLENWQNARPHPVVKGSQYDSYLRVIGAEFKAYPYGFNISGPTDKPEYGAIEFIFERDPEQVEEY